MFTQISLMVLLICQVESQDPILRIRRTKPKIPMDSKLVRVEQGKTVTLDCQVENKPVGSTVKWQLQKKDSKGNMTVIPISKDDTVEDNIAYSVDIPYTFTWRLHIRNIQVKDVGDYVCYVTLTKNSRVEEKVGVDVLIQPTFKQGRLSSDIKATKGNEVELLCEAEGRPTPKISWKRLGGKVLPGGQEEQFSTRILIKDIKKEDGGIYKCRAKNTLGSITREMKVEVEYAPEITVVTPIYQKVGYLIELQCFIEANPTLTEKQVVWLKEKGGTSTEITSDGRLEVKLHKEAFNSRTLELKINNVIEDDFGKYKCQASNSEGSGSKVIELKASDTPQESKKVGRIISAAGLSASSRLLMLLSSVLVLLVSRLLH